MTDLPEQSPDPHFTSKLATIRTAAELDAFSAEIKQQRQPTVAETHAIAVRAVEIRKGSL